MNHARHAVVVVAILHSFLPIVAVAQSCFAPTRPFMPNEPDAVRAYAELLRDDFENYISDIQNYFLCLDRERARAFDEAKEVTDEYVRFVEIVSE